MFDRRISIAPMMDYTDRHDRYFLRLFSPHIVLYTEMLTTAALLNNADPSRWLLFDESEHPLALQLGGNDPQALADCARMAVDYGYDEINLNVGCPSDRVQSGCFGAALMAQPELVADCVTAMQDAVSIPVTVKTRIGIDDRDSYEELCHFITTVKAGGCDTFIVHARKAWLKGLSPKQNRDIPPLCYDTVYQLKKDFPALHLTINGGVKTVDDALTHLAHVDGVMIGREAYSNPYLLAQLQQQVYGEALPSRETILQRLLPYIEQQLSQGVRLQQITRHILGLFQGLPGARAWRRHLSEQAYRKNAGVDVLLAAAEFVL